jgi:hypothetical protein
LVVQTLVLLVELVEQRTLLVLQSLTLAVVVVPEVLPVVLLVLVAVELVKLVVLMLSQQTSVSLIVEAVLVEHTLL